MNLLYINYPSWLKPEIIPGFPVRWYGLMYIFAFATAYIIYRRQIKERNFPMTDDDLSGLFTYGILGLLLGARIFYALVYDTSGYYIRRPWLIFWPFQDGKFTGLQGMSYHGGAIGGALGVLLYAKVKKRSFRELADMFCVAIPLGYTFGRLGNFINGELYGRVTTAGIGMLFPHARPLPASESWVTEFAEQLDIAVTSNYVNLPRHPSQLYEMVFEGLVLWGLLWLVRNHKPFKGFLIGMYFMGYGFFRFFIEYFREPDSHIGYPIDFVKSGLPTAYSHPFLSFSTGQILCFLMILFGAAWIFICSRLPDKEVTYLYDKNQREPVKQQTTADKNKQRKLRKKLK